MRKKPLVSTVQLVLLAVGSALVFPYTFMPILVSPPANQDVWIVFLMAVFYIIIINAPLLFIMNKFKGISASKAIETIMGKPLGKAVALIYVLFFLVCSTLCMDVMSQFIKTYLKPATPFWAITAFLAVPLAYMSYKGAGTIGRVAPFFVTFLMFTIGFFLVFAIPQMDPKDLQPVLAESTFLQLNLGAFYAAVRFSEILIFFVFSFYLGEKASILKTYFVGISVYAVCFLLILLPTILVLGDEFARHVWSPYFVFAGQVEVFGFITRVQAFFVAALVPVAILKITTYNYMASHVLSNIFGTKTHKVFTIIFVLFSYLVCLIPIMQKTTTFEFLTSDRFFPFMTLPVIFILPVLMLIVYIVRRKKINAALAFKAPGEEAQK